MAGQVIIAPPSAVRGFSWIKTDKDDNFVDAIVQNAMDEENILNFPDLAEIRHVVIESDQNLYYQLFFYRTDGFASADLDIDSFIGWINLDLATHGEQIAGAGKWLLDVRLTEPLLYQDSDASQELHIGLVNRSAAAKIAGVTGEVVIKIGFTPVG